jgi:hypothetical protein
VKTLKRIASGKKIKLTALITIFAYQTSCAGKSVDSSETTLCNNVLSSDGTSAELVSLKYSRGGMNMDVLLKNTGQEDIKYSSHIATATLTNGRKISFYEDSNISNSRTNSDLPGYVIIFSGKSREFHFSKMPKQNSDEITSKDFLQWKMPGFTNSKKDLGIECHVNSPGT